MSLQEARKNPNSETSLSRGSIERLWNNKHDVDLHGQAQLDCAGMPEHQGLNFDLSYVHAGLRLLILQRNLYLMPSVIGLPQPLTRESCRNLRCKHMSAWLNSGDEGPAHKAPGLPWRCCTRVVSRDSRNNAESHARA